MKFIEYDLFSGRIVSVITSLIEPEVSEGYGILRINEDDNINTSLYCVKDGVLVKNYETKIEKLERERLRNEQRIKVRSRLISMQSEFFFAAMNEDEMAIKELKKEFQKLKAYL